MTTQNDTIHRVYLVPGFFGFGGIGGLTYFHHVRDIIQRDFDAANLTVEIYEVNTLPTASIRRRAGRLLETIIETASTDDGPIHLIGHSTGGLDARLLATPNSLIDIPAPFSIEAFASRIQTVVSVATPHFGTPMATFFSSVLGAQLLYLLSLSTIYTMQFGKIPLTILLSIGSVFTKIDDVFGFENSVLDEFYDKLFDDFDAEKQEQISTYMESILEDQSLVGQLTPGGIDLLNAAAEDRPSVRYGSVVMMAKEPGLDAVKSIGVDPYRQASHVIYRFLHWLVEDEDADYTHLNPEQTAVLKNAYGDLPTPLRSDGIVPTLSQVWGEVFYAGHGDHLDVVGHFNDDEHDPPHYDWIATGTSFNRQQFDELWTNVNTFILNSGD